MSIVYTADIFCDGKDCSAWIPGTTSNNVPSKSDARLFSQSRKEWILGHKGNDYCPTCAKKLREGIK